MGPEEANGLPLAVPAVGLGSYSLSANAVFSAQHRPVRPSLCGKPSDGIHTGSLVKAIGMDSCTSQHLRHAIINDYCVNRQPFRRTFVLDNVYACMC